MYTLSMERQIIFVTDGVPYMSSILGFSFIVCLNTLRQVSIVVLLNI